MAKKQNPSLEDLGLDEPAPKAPQGFDSTAPPKPNAIEKEWQPAQRKAPATKASQTRPAAKPITDEQRDYPMLFAYMAWLKWVGIVGNVACIMVGLHAIGAADVTALVQSIEGWLAFNFLFVVSQLVRLLVDAKRDLATIAKHINRDN